MRKAKDVEKLRAALRYLEKGYKNIQNEKLAAVYFNQFSKEVNKIENLKRAAMDLRKKHGNEYAYTVNLVINEMSLQGYKFIK